MGKPNAYEWTAAQLYIIAREQKNLIYVFLCSLIVMLGVIVLSLIHGDSFLIVFIIIRLALLFAAIYYVGKLAGATGNSPFFYGLLLLVPLAGLITILHLNNIATVILKTNGIRVGFMGVGKEEVERLKERSKLDYNQQGLGQDNIID